MPAQPSHASSSSYVARTTGKSYGATSRTSCSYSATTRSARSASCNRCPPPPACGCGDSRGRARLRSHRSGRRVDGARLLRGRQRATAVLGHVQGECGLRSAGERRDSGRRRRSVRYVGGFSSAWDYWDDGASGGGGVVGGPDAVGSDQLSQATTSQNSTSPKVSE